MAYDIIFISTPIGKREIDWTELRQLRKDILWVYDENAGGLHHAFIPRNSFQLRYWEYVTLSTEKSLSEIEIKFYRHGALIITLCMTIEYLDTISGDQNIFGDVGVNYIRDFISAFEPPDSDGKRLKDIVLLGLSMANSMTDYDLKDSSGFTHPDMDTFDKQLNWVDDTFVKPYFNIKDQKPNL